MICQPPADPKRKQMKDNALLTSIHVNITLDRQAYKFLFGFDTCNFQTCQFQCIRYCLGQSGFDIKAGFGQVRYLS